MAKTSIRSILFVLFVIGLSAQTPQDKQKMRELWNQAFTDPEQTFNRKPNAFLMKAVEGKTGTALDIGMGQGRNAIALAKLGWDVTGVDISNEAVAQALAEAKKQHVTIHTIVAAVDEVNYGVDRYDLIYAIFENWIATQYADKYLPALKPGGLVVIESFQADVSKEIGRPLGNGVNELLHVFDRLRIVHYEDTIGPADWNDGKPSPIVRFIARREK